MYINHKLIYVYKSQVKTTAGLTLCNKWTFLNISFHLPFMKKYLRKKHSDMYLKNKRSVYIECLITCSFIRLQINYWSYSIGCSSNNLMSKELQNDRCKFFRKWRYHFETQLEESKSRDRNVKYIHGM